MGKVWYYVYMKKKKKMRTSLIPSCKRVPIESRSTPQNVSKIIHKGKNLGATTFGFAKYLSGVINLRK